ncbi:hypothetical protein LEN26_017273 [Aphanomyces euteiches]|nr:hypothetical protein LEN26_017273 [Aphanomyces euteiches]KAH9112236.1 hypothetical protein AeMF1_013411 [Aphanomyces euteiches]
MRLFALFGATVAGAATTTRDPKIDPALWTLLQSNQPVDAMVELKQQPASFIESFEIVDPAEQVRKKLMAATSNAAATVKSLLAPSGRRLTESQCPGSAASSHLWIAGRMHVKGLTLCIAQELVADDSVLRLRKQEVEEIDTSAIAQASPVDTLPDLWAADMIHAPLVWDGGNTGEGIVIGSIDTGVRATHSLYASKIRPGYNWFDPINSTATPTDDIGHGTHITGILVGDDGVGIAPGAQWISCRGCGSDCTESALLSCMQFMLCPTDAQGNNADCSKKPHVINNSWGSGVSKSVYLAAFQAWEDAGILAVASNGNLGPSCSTVGSPADYPTALAVGMMTQDYVFNGRSSRGPTKNNTSIIKPDIAAPGFGIYSASYTGDNLYASLSGSSQAAPHVSGTAALMLAANPSLTPAQIRTAMTTHTETASIVLGFGGQNCGGVSDLSFPNNNYGSGLVNASFAVESVAVASSQAPTDSPTPVATEFITDAPTPAVTEAPTDAQTTPAPTEAPTTQAPTDAPTTEAPTTQAPTQAPTDAPTTQAPTTLAPTDAPTTQAPTTQAPTQAPTDAPTTQAPTTQTPTTQAPTDAPTTQAPTDAPTTQAPIPATTPLVTSSPSTSTVTTKSPTTTSTTDVPTTTATTQVPITTATTRTPMTTIKVPSTTAFTTTTKAPVPTSPANALCPDTCSGCYSTLFNTCFNAYKKVCGIFWSTWCGN